MRIGMYSKFKPPVQEFLIIYYLYTWVLKEATTFTERV
jgi:hypothetical protein